MFFDIILKLSSSIIVIDSKYISDQYTIVRLSQLKHEVLQNDLNQYTENVKKIVSIKQLNDKLFKMIILKSYCSILQKKINSLFLDLKINLHYNSMKFKLSDVRYLNYNITKMQSKNKFLKRAKRMKENVWIIAITYYFFLINAVQCWLLLSALSINLT